MHKLAVLLHSTQAEALYIAPSTAYHASANAKGRTWHAVDEAAARAVGAGAGERKGAAQLRLVLGVAGHGAQLLGAVSKLQGDDSRKH